MAKKPKSKPATTKKVDTKQILKRLQRHYPDAHCALNFENPFQLLIATILSAQCTDDRVNQVTAVLFPQYPTPESLAKASVEDIEAIIRPTGFFKTKAFNIKKCCQTLVLKHGGQVPQKLEDLVELSGVGRKTANVVLGNAFNIISGIVVDTHVTRLSNRFGWTQSTNAVIIERELQKIIPEKDWIIISHWLISHGRQICKARNPQCSKCFLFDLCPRRGV